MAIKRSAPRKRKRLVVDFNTTLSKTSGFTHDLSRSGLFVCTIRIPKIGEILRATLYLPDGKHVPIEGTVVRSFRVPSTLRSLIPSGFGLRLSKEKPAEYEDFISSIEDRPSR